MDVTNGVSDPKSPVGTVTMTVQPVNDAPTAVSDLSQNEEDVNWLVLIAPGRPEPTIRPDGVRYCDSRQRSKPGY